MKLAKHVLRSVKDKDMVPWGDAKYYLIGEFIEILKNKRARSNVKTIFDELIENLEELRRLK